jgi:hypothetical protein
MRVKQNIQSLPLVLIVLGPISREFTRLDAQAIYYLSASSEWGGLDADSV